MPLTPSDVPQFVEDDVKSGLGRWFESFTDEHGDGWTPSEPFKSEQPMTNGALTTVPWSYRCRHIDWFQNAPPTGKPLTIVGVSIVDHSTDDPSVSRHVDWLSVMYQLGYTLYLRQLVETPDRDALNFGPSGPP